MTKEQEGQTGQRAYLICGKLKPLPESLFQFSVGAEAGEQCLESRGQGVNNGYEAGFRRRRRAHLRSGGNGSVMTPRLFSRIQPERTSEI